MSFTTRSDLISRFMEWLGRPGDTIITDDEKSNILTVAEGRIFYGAKGNLESPPVRVRAMQAYVQFPLAAVETGGTTSGTVNAQTSVLSGYTLAYGSTASIPSGLTNTDSMTLDIGSTGAKTVKKGQFRANLAAGDWREDIAYNVWHDGADYLITPLPGAVPLPTDCLEVQHVWLSGEQPLRNLAQPEFLSNAVGATAAKPTTYTKIGDYLLPGPTADTDYQAHMLYWQKPAALSGASDTNWLLTNYPAIYLYAMLLESAPYIGHDERIPVWYGLYSSAAAGVTLQDAVARVADSRKPVSEDHIVNDVKRRSQ